MFRRKLYGGVFDIKKNHVVEYFPVPSKFNLFQKVEVVRRIADEIFVQKMNVENVTEVIHAVAASILTSN